MRPATDYSLSEIMGFSDLLDYTNEAAEELEEYMMELQEVKKLSSKETLFTLARVVHEFIKMHEDYANDGDSLDAEAAFNDYLLACRDLSGEDNGSMGIEGQMKGN